MKIALKKINSNPKEFTYLIKKNNVNLEFNGDFYKTSEGLVKIRAKIQGELGLIDDLSGEDYISNISREIEILVSDGLWVQKGDEFLDVVESFDGFLDLDSIFQGEIEAIKLEYHTQN